MSSIKSIRGNFTSMAPMYYNDYTNSHKESGVSIGDLIAYAESHGLPLSTKIYCEHIDDSYLYEHKSESIRIPGEPFIGETRACWTTLDLPCEYSNTCRVYDHEASKKGKSEIPQCCKDCPSKSVYINSESISSYDNKLLIHSHY